MYKLKSLQDCINEGIEDRQSDLVDEIEPLLVKVKSKKKQKIYQDEFNSILDDFEEAYDDDDNRQMKELIGELEDLLKTIKKSVNESVNEDWFRNAHNWMILSDAERMEWIASAFPKMAKSKIKKFAQTPWTKLPTDPFKHSGVDVPYTKNPAFNMNESMLNNQEVFEDSAGTIELLKPLTVRDQNGKTIKLPKGAQGRHKRIGWDSDFFVWQGQDIPMMWKGQEQFPESDVEIII